MYLSEKKNDYMKRFHSTDKTFQYHLHRTLTPPPQKKKQKNKKKQKKTKKTKQSLSRNYKK